MENNEIEQLRKVISEEITKQLEPIVCSLEKMAEEIEDFHLYLEAEKRINNPKSDKCISQDELMNKLGITKEDLDSIEDIEIELKETKNQKPINAIKKIVKSELSQLSYDTWIADGEGVIERNILRWFCANTFTQDILDRRYRKLIVNACKLLKLNINEVEILVKKNNIIDEEIDDILNSRNSMYERLGEL